ncbi:hypothetical protein ACA910_000910 [Epithemia clementina (nom. ined.)]
MKSGYDNKILRVIFWFLVALAIQEAVAYIAPSVRPCYHQHFGRSTYLSIPTSIPSSSRTTTRTGVASSPVSTDESSSSSSSVFDEEDEAVVENLKLKKKTLYEILGAQPNFTRAELKQRYVALAKITHPDARRNGAGAAAAAAAAAQNSVNGGEALDFTEIAAAWRILSDEKQRKRYDRSLKAEQISDNISAWVGDLAKQAAPVVEGFGNVANNFLRKTTATTLAGVQAAASRAYRKEDSRSSQSQTSTAEVEKAADAAMKDIRTANAQKKNSSFGDTIKSAVDAAILAGRKVDGLELLEKSEALEARALKESDQAAKAKRELQAVMERRLDMALHTPGSGLSASDALMILEDFNKTVADDLTPWDRAMLRHTIEYEIQELKKEEGEFVKAQMADTSAQSAYRDCVQAKFQAQQDLVNAEKAEILAREAWEAAKNRLMESKEMLSSSIQNLAQAESQVKKSDWEMEFRALTLERQAEKVRNALRHKQKQVRRELGLDLPDIPVNDSAQRLQELEQLRNEERLMAETSSRLELMAERLFERAHSLRERAQELDRDENR